MTRILVVDKLASFLREEDVVAQGITPVLFNEQSGIPSGEFEGIVPVVTTAVRAADIARLPRLRIIANYGVGYDNIDVAAARERGIAVTNTPGVLTDATSELTWALLLATARRLGEGERLVRAGQWTGWTPTQLRGLSLKGKTLAIIGAGRIGRRVGEIAAAFGMRVKYWNRGSAEELRELLSTADVVSIHLAKSADTERLVDPRVLKDGAILINTARGAIVDEQLLIAELLSGRISAGLDVYVNEPHVPAELTTLENVVLLPHLGSATHEARQAMWDLAWGNVLARVQGRTLLTPVGL